MAHNSAPALKPGTFFRVLDNGALSVVDPSTRSMDIIGTLPKSSVISPVGSSKGNSVKDPFSIFPGVPNPVRGAAGWALNILGGCVGGVIAAVPSAGVVLVGGSMSFVSAMCEQRKEAPAGLDGDVQPAGNKNAQGIISEGLNAIHGIGRVTSILGDTMKVASLIQDIAMLPLRAVAALRPLGSKANNLVDMITNENVGLVQIYEEIFTNNINNITKLALVATVGTGGLVVICFAVAAAAFVLGLCAIPLFWSLASLVVYGTCKSRRMSKVPAALDAQPPALLTPSTPPTRALPLQKSSRSYFL